MKIRHLKLVNFRNYSLLDINLNDNINLFIGDNGQGKTNILESIYVLSLSKSNRYGLDADMIKFDNEFCKIEGEIENEGLVKKHEILISKLSKQLFINSKEIKRNRDYISNFCVISFAPTDLEIIKGSPSIRRNLLNVDISQINNAYVNYLNEYNSIIKMRNEYLKKINLNGNTDLRYLEIINDKLIEKADKIYEIRFKFMDAINTYLSKIFKKMTGLDGLKIVFENNISLEKYSHDDVYTKMREKFKKNYNFELMQGTTVYGPHRDDFSFYLKELDMKNYASQGQQRIAVIALKIAELYIFKDILGSYPVLLLDDVFSEIDCSKRNKIIKFLKSDIQTIITTTDINDIDDSLLENANIFNIKNNKVTKKGRINNGRRKSRNKL